MTWAFKRQIFSLAIVLVVFSVFGFLVFYPYFNQAPTCADSRQNGDETGIDCGGSCVRACLKEADPLSIIWSRAFKVLPGRYNAVAYIENHNKNK